MTQPRGARDPAEPRGPKGKAGGRAGGVEEEEDAGRASACARVREEAGRGRGGQGQRLTESERRGGGRTRGSAMTLEKKLTYGMLGGLFSSSISPGDSRGSSGH